MNHVSYLCTCTKAVPGPGRGKMWLEPRRTQSELVIDFVHYPTLLDQGGLKVILENEGVAAISFTSSVQSLCESVPALVGKGNYCSCFSLVHFLAWPGTRDMFPHPRNSLMWVVAEICPVGCTCLVSVCVLRNPNFSPLEQLLTDGE